MAKSNEKRGFETASNKNLEAFCPAKVGMNRNGEYARCCSANWEPANRP